MIDYNEVIDDIAKLIPKLERMKDDASEIYEIYEVNSLIDELMDMLSALKNHIEANETFEEDQEP